MDTQLPPANALRTRNTYVSYLSCVGYAAKWLCSCQYLPSPMEYVSREKCGCAAMWLHSSQYLHCTLPLEVCQQGIKWLHGYAVVKTTPPPQNMLVRKKVASWLCSRGFLHSRVAIFTLYMYSLRQPAFCMSAQPHSHTFQDLFWSGGVFSS